MDSSHGGPLAATLHDLQQIFGERLQAFVGYGHHGNHDAPSLALVRTLTADDLSACAARAASWHRAGSATPLLLTKDEFAGSLDAFPIEYGEIIETHHVLFGVDPFAGLAIRPEDFDAPARSRSRATCSTCARTSSSAVASHRPSPRW